MATDLECPLKPRSSLCSSPLERGIVIWKNVDRLSRCEPLLPDNGVYFCSCSTMLAFFVCCLTFWLFVFFFCSPLANPCLLLLASLCFGMLLYFVYGFAYFRLQFNAFNSKVCFLVAVGCYSFWVFVFAHCLKFILQIKDCSLGLQRLRAHTGPWFKFCDGFGHSSFLCVTCLRGRSAERP